MPRISCSRGSLSDVVSELGLFSTQNFYKGAVFLSLLVSRHSVLFVLFCSIENSTPGHHTELYPQSSLNCFILTQFHIVIKLPKLLEFAVLAPSCPTGFVFFIVIFSIWKKWSGCFVMGLRVESDWIEG